ILKTTRGRDRGKKLGHRFLRLLHGFEFVGTRRALGAVRLKRRPFLVRQATGEVFGDAILELFVRHTATCLTFTTFFPAAFSCHAEAARAMSRCSAPAASRSFRNPPPRRNAASAAGDSPVEDSQAP